MYPYNIPYTIKPQGFYTHKFINLVDLTIGEADLIVFQGKDLVAKAYKFSRKASEGSGKPKSRTVSISEKDEYFSAALESEHFLKLHEVFEVPSRTHIYENVEGGDNLCQNI